MDADVIEDCIDIKKQTIIKLTSFIMHKHYCENDSKAIIKLFDKQLSWIGTAEQEYAIGFETISGIIRQFSGNIPKCNISDEQYDVFEITPVCYLCSGRMWISTDSSTNMYLRVHQRITTVFRWVECKAYCCHIHISNPYSEMADSDVGFPTQMGQQSYEYLQECVAAQKKQIEVQMAMLRRMSFEDSLTGLFNRNKFNQYIDSYQEVMKAPLGVACFDLNKLKETNDTGGHVAGDKLICRTAYHISQAFHEKAYRIGGDEFVVIDEELNEEEFKAAISNVCKNMEQENISIAVGLSWRSVNCDVKEQINDADTLMYRDKLEFHRNNR